MVVKQHERFGCLAVQRIKLSGGRLLGVVMRRHLLPTLHTITGIPGNCRDGEMWEADAPYEHVSTN